MGKESVEIRLVFEDWRKYSASKQGTVSIYDTEKGLELSMGDLHSGTTFSATIQVDSDTAVELRKALDERYIPVFYAIKEKK